MNRLHVKTRITLALVSLAVATALVCSKLVPDHRQHVKRQRAVICEILAVNTQVALQTKTHKNVRTVLEICVDRTEELLSAGIRSTEGRPLVEVGEHFVHWPDELEQESTDGFLQVPIFAEEDGTQLPRELCRLELRFCPLAPDNLIQALARHPWLHFFAAFGLASFLVYRWYLGRIFHHLDPQKAVPQRVRSAYDFLAGGLVAMDRNQHVVLVNSAFTDIVGLSRAGLLGKQLSALDWLTDDPLPWDEVHQNRSQEVRSNLEISSDQSGIRTLMVTASQFVGQDGEYRGVLASFDDVTPLESARAELKKSKDAAEAANVAKSAFLANMSHEIRTPMNAILGFAELMRRGFDLQAQERLEYVEIIHSSGQHLLGLINDILDLSKVESGRMKIESIDCHPHQILHEVVSVMRARAEEKGLDLGFSVEGSIPETILADPLRLRQVITNLVGNALKFTETGGVQVLVQSFVRDEVPILAFAVGDTGIGIPQDKVDAIFDPFSQADESTTRRFGGTGLGLSISRKLTELMGGRLTATSVVGQGSVFTAEIVQHTPADTAYLTHEQAQERLAAIQESSLEIVELPPGHVLVVDDGESNRKLLELILTRAGVTVTSAENGEEAVKAVMMDEFDAVLMDVQMPVMDGYTALGLIQEAGYDMPIVALTAHAMKEEEDRALAAGFSNFLTKPVDIDRLFTLVAELLGGKVLRRAGPAVADTRLPASQSYSHEETSEPIRCSLPMDDEEFRAISVAFVERLKSQLVTFLDVLEAERFDELANHAHWLKGAGGTAGFQAFTEPARALEEAAKANDVAACQECVTGIIQLTQRIVVDMPLGA